MTRKRNNHKHPSSASNLVKLAEIKTIIPADGTAVELPLPEGIQAFFSEEGKLMLQKKNQEPANAPENFGITYDEIADRLFLDKDTTFHKGFGKIETCHCPKNHDFAKDESNCKTEEQVRKNLAYNKLLNIATYLNGGWTPVFGDILKPAYAIGYNKDGNVSPIACWSFNVGVVLFPSEYICEQAIRIMGEKSIHDLLNYEY